MLPGEPSCNCTLGSALPCSITISPRLALFLFLIEGFLRTPRKDVKETTRKTLGSLEKPPRIDLDACDTREMDESGRRLVICGMHWMLQRTQMRSSWQHKPMVSINESLNIAIRETSLGSSLVGQRHVFDCASSRCHTMVSMSIKTDGNGSLNHTLKRLIHESLAIMMAQDCNRMIHPSDFIP